MMGTGGINQLARLILKMFSQEGTMRCTYIVKLAVLTAIITKLPCVSRQQSVFFAQ